MSIAAPQMVSAAAAPASAVHQDPTVGPMTRDEARHAHDPLHFTAAQGPIQPLRPRAARGAAAPAAPAAATAVGPLQREVFGFAPYWELAQNTNWNYSLLSTIGYFGLGIYSDGTINTTDQGWTGWNSQNLATIINAAHQRGTRVVLVIKPSNRNGDSTASTVNQIVTSSTVTQQTITNTIGAIASHNLDGVNVDFEGSSTGYPNAQSGFTTFMTQLSQQVHQQYPNALVTADTYTGSASWDGGIFKIGDLAPVVDYMFVMAYDESFGNMPSGGAQAGPNAPLNGWTYNDTLSVNQYLTKAAASKIVLGVPYYGYKWCTTSTAAYAAATRDANGTVVCPDGAATPTAATYSEILTDFACAPQLQKNWDSTAASPWATWNSPASNDPCGGNHNSTRELYYDDATSLGLKYDLVNSNNLRGTGMWALGFDGSSSDLWNEIALKFVDWSAWSSLGGSLSTAPAVASQGSGKLDVFAAGQDHALYQNSFNGSWSGWQLLGGRLTSDPAAVSWGTGRIDVFARGSDNALYHMVYDGTWHYWERIDARMSSGPAVASSGPNHLDVFAAGSDGQLYQQTFGMGWEGWHPLGGRLSSAPAAVAGPNGQIDVVARGMDNALYHKSFNGTSWNDWELLGGSLTTGAAISTRSNGQLDVFAAGRDGSLFHREFTVANSWGVWQWLGGRLTATPASVSWAATRVDVFARSTDNALYQKSFITA